MLYPKYDLSFPTAVKYNDNTIIWYCIDKVDIYSVIKDVSILQSKPDWVVDVNVYREILAEKKGSIYDYQPIFFFDIPNKAFYSCCPEPISYEDEVPEGWEGLYDSFVELVPDGMRYWTV